MEEEGGKEVIFNQKTRERDQMIRPGSAVVMLKQFAYLVFELYIFHYTFILWSPTTLLIVNIISQNTLYIIFPVLLHSHSFTAHCLSLHLLKGV